MNDVFCEKSYLLGVSDALSGIDRRPATEKQKDFMETLGLSVKQNLTLKEAKIRISAVLEAKKYFQNDECFYPEEREWSDL